MDEKEDSRFNSEPFAAFLGSFHPVHNMRATAIAIGPVATTAYVISIQIAMVLVSGGGLLRLPSEWMAKIADVGVWDTLFASRCVWKRDEHEVMLRVSHTEVVDVLRHLSVSSLPMQWITRPAYLVGQSAALPDPVVCE